MFRRWRQRRDEDLRLGPPPGSEFHREAEVEPDPQQVAAQARKLGRETLAQERQFWERSFPGYSLPDDTEEYFAKKAWGLTDTPRRPEEQARFSAAEALGLAWAPDPSHGNELSPPSHFVCSECGRWAEANEASESRARSIRTLHLAEYQVQQLLSATTPNPFRIAGMVMSNVTSAATTVGVADIQRAFGRTYEDAVELLTSLEQLGLMDRSGGGLVRAGARCGPCYERRAKTASAPPEQTRDAIPAQLRFRVLQRDGFRCQYCGRSARDGAILHLDHVVPYSAGGETSEDNLITACEQCNLGKSARPVLPE